MTNETRQNTINILVPMTFRWLTNTNLSHICWPWLCFWY